MTMTGDDDLTPTEQAYFDTGGKTDLFADLPPSEPAAPPPAEPAAPPPAEPDPAPPVAEAEPRQGEVPHQALHQAREAAKAAKAEATAARQQLQEQAARLARIEAMVPRQQPNEPALTVEQRLERQEQFNRHQVEYAQMQQAKAQFISNYADQAREFAVEQPDFKDAYNHALTVRRAMWARTGITSQDEINTLLENEEAAIVNRAMQEGRNPAEVLYGIAQEFGYRPASTEPAGPTPEERTAKATETAAQQLKTLAAGQKHAKSLANAPSSGEINPSAEDLIAMDFEEFAKLTAGKNWRKYGGG